MTTQLDQRVVRLVQAAEEMLGFPISNEADMRRITPTQASTLLKEFSGDPDFRALASERGNPIAEANIWLNARVNGGDIPLGEVTRMASGLGPSAEYQRAMTDAEHGAEVADESAAGQSRTQASATTADQAKARLAELSRDPAWVEKALTRGTAEARENLSLNATATGLQLSDEQIDRGARGLPPDMSGPDAGAVAG